MASHWTPSRAAIERLLASVPPDTTPAAWLASELRRHNAIRAHLDELERKGEAAREAYDLQVSGLHKEAALDRAACTHIDTAVRTRRDKVEGTTETFVECLVCDSVVPPPK
jgi:predicted transcriptional regulator